MQKIICTDNMKVEVNLFQETKETIGGRGTKAVGYRSGICLKYLTYLHKVASYSLLQYNKPVF